MSKSEETTQEQLDEMVKPKEKKVNEKMEPVKEKPKEKGKSTIDDGKDESKVVKSKADLLMEKYNDQIEEEKDHSRVQERKAKGTELEKELGLEEFTVSDKEIQRDTINYQKRRLAYFRLESKKEWHKIPIFEGWDNEGIAIYRLVSYRYHDYPDEVAEVIDKLRAEYEDLTKVKTVFDMIKIFRDPEARTASTRAAAAKHKWIQVGSKFILHMKDKEFPKAHKDFILLVIDSAMYRQETFIPNLPIESDDTSADDQLAPEASPGQNAIA